MKGKPEVVRAFPAGNVLVAHPLAASVPGTMSSEEFKALCLDIKANGQNHSIILYEEKILDGRARYAACKDLNCEPKTKLFKGTHAEAEQLVMSNNLQRRELTSMQRAIVGAHMHLRKEAPTTQKEASEIVGVGVNTLNLAVRLLNSKNAALITRVEKGEASRSEVDELMYDREAGQRQHNVSAREEDDDDIIGEAPSKHSPGNVIPIHAGTGTIVGKRGAVGHTATETPLSKVVNRFKELDQKERKAFIEMAWQWLAPALQAAGKLPKAQPAPKGKPVKRKAA